jgi:hypothetical protein
MKKIILTVNLLLLLILLCSCAKNQIITPNTVSTSSIVSNNKSSSQAANPQHTIKDFYPYKVNVKYVYEGKGNEYASYNVFTDYISDSRIQLRVNNGGTEVVKVLENKNDELTMLLSKGECYYRENLTQSTSGNTEILLKEPLIKGTTWILADNRKRYISNVDVEITTPLSTYKALEVTTEDKGDKTLDYYAPSIGLVKTVFIANGDEISSTLSKIEENAFLTQTVKFFYPNINDDKLYFVNRQLTFHSNDITKIVFEKAYKDMPKGNLGAVFGTGVKINSLYLNKDNMVYIDFSKELISEMNAGSGYESMILQSITNTFGIYYGVNKVYITIEGKSYVSGHIEMKKGEYFTVNLKNSAELK